MNYEIGKWELSSAFVYGSGRRFTPAAERYALRNPATRTFDAGQLLPADLNSRRLLGYHRLDVKASRSVRWFGKPADWYVQVFNVYNRRNEWFVSYDTDQLETEPVVGKMLPIIPTFGFSIAF